MKSIFFFCIIIFSNSAFCQPVPYTIKGKIIQDSPYKYAYLHIFSSKKTVRAPIKQNHFEFNGLKENKDTLVTAAIFLGADSTKTHEESKFISFYGAVDERDFVIENATILIDPGNIGEAKVNGSALNLAYDDMLSTIKTGNYLEYFNKNRSSPVSLIFLLALTGTNRLPLSEAKADILSYYELLTADLKNAYLGKKIAKIIKEEYQN